MLGTQGVDDRCHVACHTGRVDEGQDGGTGVGRAFGRDELRYGVPDADVVQVLAGRGAAEDVLEGGARGG